jgi:menaquinone-specific isochorismate synthase
LISELDSLIHCLEEELINGKSSLVVQEDTIDKLFEYTDCENIVYWKDKTSSQLYLGLGVYKKIEDIESYSKNIDLLDYHSFGGLFFENEKHATKLWKDFSKFHFIIPEYLLVQNKKKIELMKYNKEALPLTNYFNNSAQILTNNIVEKITQCPSHTEWITQITKLKAQLNSIFNKVVLSKMTSLNLSEVINSKKIFVNNKNLMNNCHHFYLSPKRDVSFFSFTPETLYKKDNNNIFLEAIAGTRPRGTNTEKDEVLGQELLESNKEQEEHEIVVNMISNSMKDLGTFTKGKQSLLKLKNVQHIYTPLTIQATQQKNSLNLIDILHPTPAVGGFPKEQARVYIQENEKFERGLFAAPIGHITRDKEEIAVGIRSALVLNNKAHIFGGCGIVKDSDPQSEWDEITVKTKYLIDSFYE